MDIKKIFVLLLVLIVSKVVCFSLEYHDLGSDPERITIKNMRNLTYDNKKVFVKEWAPNGNYLITNQNLIFDKEGNLKYNLKNHGNFISWHSDSQTIVFEKSDEQSKKLVLTNPFSNQTKEIEVKKQQYFNGMIVDGDLVLEESKWIRKLGRAKEQKFIYLLNINSKNTTPLGSIDGSRSDLKSVKQFKILFARDKNNVIFSGRVKRKRMIFNINFLNNQVTKIVPFNMVHCKIEYVKDHRPILNILVQQQKNIAVYDIEKNTLKLFSAFIGNYHSSWGPNTLQADVRRSISPSGKLMLVTMIKGDEAASFGGVYLYNMDGKHIKFYDGVNPLWSPQGDRVAFGHQILSLARK